MPTHVSRLPQETLDYLELVQRSHSKDSTAEERLTCPGVFVPWSGGTFDSPRAGWELALVCGLALLAAAAYMTWVLTDTPREKLLPVAVACGVAVGFAFVLLRIALTQWGRPGADPRLGDFLFADATRVWEVAGGYVQTFELGDHLAAVGHRHSNNGTYTHSSVIARAGGSGTRTWSIGDSDQAQRLLDFLLLIRQLRRSGEVGDQELLEAGPGHVAHAIMLTLDKTSSPGRFAPVVDPPGPLPAEPVAQGSGPSVGLWVQGVVVTVAAAVGLVKGGEYLRDDRLFAAAVAEPRESFQAVDQYLDEYPDGRHAAEVRDLRDDRMFDLAAGPTGEPGELRAIDRYLKEYPEGRHTLQGRDLRDDWYFAAARREPESSEHLQRLDEYVAEYPNGRHAAEVTALRDDSLFATARKLSEASASPGGLRKYLAERRNTRHRQEANQLIGGYYERTAAELRVRAEQLKALAEKDKGAQLIDPQLVRSLISLVESLKGVDDPVLTVGFVPEIEAEPKAAEAKAGEEETYKFHLSKSPHKDQLVQLERKNPGKTAVIPQAGTFNNEYIRSRENMIFTRLSDAIEKGIKADILTLRMAKPGEKPNIEVRYRIFPAGFLIPFQEVNEDNSHKRMIGLVREYFIDWTMTFRPPGGGEPTVYRTGTRPGPNLLYRMEAGDPDWAIYAVSLYSSFYALSDQMIRALGQDPGPMPNAFTWQGTSSFRNTKQPATGNPQ